MYHCFPLSAPTGIPSLSDFALLYPFRKGLYTERFSSEEEHQRAIEALSKDLDAVKQSILDNSKIVKKGVSGISIKIYPENE